MVVNAIISRAMCSARGGRSVCYLISVWVGGWLFTRVRGREQFDNKANHVQQGGSWVMGHIWVWVMGRPMGQNPWVSVGVGQCRDPH